MKGKALPLVAALALVAVSCANRGTPTTRVSSDPPLGSTTTSQVTAEPLGIKGLTFGEFLEKSYSLLAIRDPEALTSAGIAESFGLGNDQLNDLSHGFITETQALETTILGELRKFDRESLSAAERVSYDGYEWYLDQQIRGHEFIYHHWPVHHFVNSYNFNLLLFLQEEHTIESRDDARDYLSRLLAIRGQVGQVIDGLQRRQDLGIFPVAEIVDRTIRRLESDVGGATDVDQVDVTRLPLYTSFVERLDAVDALSDTERAELADLAASAIEESFVPAWIGLADYMRSIRAQSSTEAGVGRHPDGAAFYRHLLRGQTSAELSPAEVHEIGLVQVERVQKEMREAFDDLGYPSDESLVDLRVRASQEAGSTSGSESVALNEAMIVEAEAVFRDWFREWPEVGVAVVPDAGGGGFYIPAAIDGSRPGLFHAGTGRSSLMSLPTVNYHEAVPGHHTQIAVAQTLDLPSFQRLVIYNGFTEGWALYAEGLANEAGLYEDDPYGNIGRLELELLRAVRLVVDTGIHAMGWSSDEARVYMNQVIPTWSHEVERYMVLPGQATGYMIGMQEILRLRELVRAQEGDAFDIAEFHSLVLGSGNVPLVVLDRLVTDYLDEDR